MERVERNIGRLRSAPAGTALLLAVVGLAGCGFFGSTSTAPTAIPTRTPLPTFTPTLAVANESTPVTVQMDALPPVETLPPTDLPATSTPEPPVATKPLLTIASDAVNVRSAPSTSASLMAMVTAGQQFDVIGRTLANDWWQICCVNGQSGWVFGELVSVTDGDAAPVAAEPATLAEVAAPISAPVAQPEAAATEPAAEPAPSAPPDPLASSAGFFAPNAQYQIVSMRVLGLEENNGGIRDSSAQHHIFLTVLDENDAGVDGAVVRNLVGEKGEVVTGSKGPGKAEITMYYEPFKLSVVSDPSGPVTSHVSNQMGLVYPHLPDLVGKLGDINYEYGACPTIDIKCEWPITALHFSYEITFQKVR